MDEKTETQQTETKIQVPVAEITEEQVFKLLKTAKKFLKYLGIAGVGLLGADEIIEIGNKIDLIIGSGIIGAIAAVFNILKYKLNIKWLP